MFSLRRTSAVNIRDFLGGVPHSAFSTKGLPLEISQLTLIAYLWPTWLHKSISQWKVVKKNKLMNEYTTKDKQVGGLAKAGCGRNWFSLWKLPTGVKFYTSGYGCTEGMMSSNLWMDGKPQRYVLVPNVVLVEFIPEDQRWEEAAVDISSFPTENPLSWEDHFTKQKLFSKARPGNHSVLDIGRAFL